MMTNRLIRLYLLLSCLYITYITYRVIMQSIDDHIMIIYYYDINKYIPFIILIVGLIISVFFFSKKRIFTSISLILSIGLLLNSIYLLIFDSENMIFNLLNLSIILIILFRMSRSSFNKNH